METKKLKRLFCVKKFFNSSRDFSPARMLLSFQCAGLPLLGAMMALMGFANTGGRRVFYIAITASLAVLMLAAILFNIKGHYRISAGITAAMAIAAPWLCMLFDSTVAAGNIMPLVFAALAIQLCSILFSLRVTVIVSALQLVALSVLVALTPGLHNADWPGFTIFIAFTATLGTVTSMLNRRRLEQIDKDRQTLKESESRLKALATRDSLTGVYNRRYMEEALHDEISRALKEKQNLSIIMADVDGFKLINDTFGHALGDMVLVRVAEILSRNTRKSDVVCRYGGDEFILVLPNCAPEDALLRAQSLRLLIGETPFSFDEGNVGHVTISIGVAALPENGTTAAELLSAADRALYDAKQCGRNRVMASCL